MKTSVVVDYTVCMCTYGMNGHCFGTYRVAGTFVCVCVCVCCIVTGVKLAHRGHVSWWGNQVKLRTIAN